MQDALRNRVFAVVTIAAMLLGSLSAVLAPATASAASAGDLIKNESLSTVYYYAPDGMRYTFPDEKTYMTWYQDFDSVETISDSDLADIALGGNIVYRPGTYWIKVQSDPKVYAVSTDGMLHWIETEDVAVDYAGSDWASHVQDVPDVFFTNYTSGTSLTSATAYDGMMYMDGSDYYIAWDGEKRMVSDLDANNMISDFYLMGEGIDDSSLTDGDEITASVAAIVDASQQGGVEEVTVVEGDLTVSVASSTPAGVTVPNSASGVEVATFALYADEEMTVSSMTVKMEGLSSTSAISSNGVYLYEGDTRLTEGRSVNSSTHKSTFSALNLDFDAGETKYVSVVVDMSTSINDGNFNFAIDSADDIEVANAEVSGSFPLEGNTMTITDLDVGGVTISKNGSIADPNLGSADAVVGKFKLEASSAEDVTFENVTLKVDQASDHSNYKIWQGSDQIGTGEYIGSKLVLFTLDEGYEIEKGENKIFSVSADIAGEAAENVKVYLNNDADLKVVGNTYGFNATVTRTDYDGDSCTASTGDCSFSTIQGGEVTVAFNGPTSGDVASGTNDYTLFDFSITSEEWVEVDSLEIDLAMTEADSGSDSAFDDTPLTDLRLVDAETGLLVSGPVELGDSTALTAGDLADNLVFAENFVIEAGETVRLLLTADVETAADANDTYTATLDISELTMEDANNDSVSSSDIIPSTDLAGYAQTVRTASLVVTLASTPTGDTTVVRGSEDVDVVGYNFAAGLGSDIEVTDLTVTVYVDEDSGGTFAAGTESSTASGDRISSCSLYDAADDSLIDGPVGINSSTTGEMLFTNFSWTIPAGETEKMYVRCNLANVNPGTADEFAWEIDAATDMTALDADGDTLASTAITASGINSAEGTKISVTNSGTLAVTVGSSTPSADILLTNTTDNHVSSFTFTATDEDFEVKTLTFSEEAAEDDGNGTDASTYANNVSLVTIEYPDETGATQTATTTMSGNEAKFSLTTTPLYVSVDDEAEVDVYVDVPVTDRASGGYATSNEKMLLDLFVDTTNDDNFSAFGVGSGVEKDDDDVSTTADPNTFVVKETKPTVSLSSSSPSGTQVPGDIEVFRFNVSAASNEDVVLQELVWAISSTDNTGTPTQWNQCDTGDTTNGFIDGTSWDFYNLSEEGLSTTLAGTWTVLASDGATCDSSADTGNGEKVTHVSLALTTAEIVPAGSTYTYSLYLDAQYASAANDDTIQITLASDPIIAVGGTWIDTTDLVDDAAFAATDTTFTADSGIDSTTSVGDLLCLDESGDGCDSADEIVLETGVSGTTVTVVRGYLGTSAQAIDDNTTILRLPSTFFWEDDGTTATAGTGEDWGSYLVDSLPVTGYSIQF